jgi:hypothetical protein
MQDYQVVFILLCFQERAAVVDHSVYTRVAVGMVRVKALTEFQIGVDLYCCDRLTP